MARIIFSLLFLGVLANAQYHRFAINPPIGTENLRLVEAPLVTEREIFLIFSDRATEREQHLFSAPLGCVGQNCWKKIELPAGERFFSTRPSGWNPLSLNRVSPNGDVMLKGWDYCVNQTQCGGVYTVRNGLVTGRIIPERSHLNDGAGQPQIIRRVGVANPTPDGNGLILQVATSQRPYVVRLELGSSELYVLARDQQGVDNVGGVYLSPTTSSIRALFAEWLADGNPIRAGQLIAGKFQSINVVENFFTHYDPQKGSRYVNERNGYIKSMESNAIERVIPPNAQLASTVSTAFVPYGARANSERPVESVVNAIDGQVLALPEFNETLAPPVAMSPASVYGCVMAVPVFRLSAVTNSGELLKGVSQNALSRLVVVQKMDCN